MNKDYITEEIRHIKKFSFLPKILDDDHLSWLEFYYQDQILVSYRNNKIGQYNPNKSYCKWEDLFCYRIKNNESTKDSQIK